MKKILFLIAVLVTACAQAQTNTSLSNLTAPTAVNQSLLPGTSATIDLGSSSSLWRNAFVSGKVAIGTNKKGNLTIKGTNGVFYVDNTATFAAKNSSGVYENYFWPRWVDNRTIINYGKGGFEIRNDSSVVTMTLTDGNNVGIGTSLPFAKLDVAGNVRIADGTQGTGKVLTSDSDGVASWQSAATNSWTVSGSNIYNNNSGYVGIGTTNPSHPLSLASSANTEPLYIKGSAAEGRSILFEPGTTGSSWELFTGSTGLRFCEHNVACDRFFIGNGGNIGIGTGTPNGQLELSLDQGRKPSTSTWTITSDERLKNIDGSYTKGLKEILQLKPILYHYKNGGDRKFDAKTLASQAVGFTAQDVQKVFPECVSKDADGYLNFNIHAILIAQVNAIQQLSAENDALKSTLDKQQQQINAALQKLNDLQAAQQACCVQASAQQTSNQSINLNSSDIASLKQNAPNPFNSRTVINYTLPQHVSNAQIKITDVKGNTIKTATVSTSGSLTVAAGSLASGTYKYSLLVDGKLIDTKTMVLTK